MSLDLVTMLFHEQRGCCSECGNGSPLLLADDGVVVRLACASCIDELDQRAARVREREEHSIEHDVAELRQRLVAAYGWAPSARYLRHRVRLAREAAR